MFDEQKIFLVYLIGAIPSIEDWSTQVSYKKEINEVENLKKVDIDPADLDVAKLQSRDIEELKRERLAREKERLKNEINKKYGVETKTVIPKDIKMEKPANIDEKQKLWEILQGKGLIKKNGL